MTGALPHSHQSTPVVVLFTGPPGTGKSTLADCAAEVLAAPVFGWDWAMASLTDFDTIQQAIHELSHLEHRRMGWSILGNLAAAQLRRGCSVVLDGVARDEEIEQIRHVAAREGAQLLVVVTSCSDEATHRGRLLGRVRGIPGWHELDWDHVAGLLGSWIEPANADLYLDAMDPLEDNAARVLDLVMSER